MHNRINLFLIAFILAGTGVIYYGQHVTASPQQGTIPTATDTPIVNDSTVTPTSTGTPTSTPTPTATVHGDATPTRNPHQPTPTAILAQPTPTPLATEATTQRCDGSPWQFTANMTTGRIDHAVAVVDNYLFAFGGFTGQPDAGIERTIINADGTLADWQRIGELPTARAYMAAVTHGNYIYILGGETNDFVYRNVERILVNGDGTLGPWEAMSPLTTKRANPGAVIYDGYIYVIGGRAPYYIALDSVERAKINADGTLSTWELMAPLVTSRYKHTTILAAPYLYVIGGYGDEERNDIEQAMVNPDGTLTAWTRTGTITASRTEAAGVAHQGYIYLFGGNHFGTPTNLVERAQYNSAATLTGWTQLNPSYTARSEIAAITKENQVYLIGGRANGGEPGDAVLVEWADLNNLTSSSENGLSINNGALYTNQTGVILNISGQPGATLMQVSNDGGFAGATWEPCVKQKAWEITRFGNSIIPRVVYTRFRDKAGNTSSVLQDDIILDVTAPTGSLAIVPSVALRQAAISAHHQPLQESRQAADAAVYLPLVFTAQADCPATGAPNITLQLSAQDDVSGVAEMMISNDAGFACAAWQPFATAEAWYVPLGMETTVYAKFRDYAGNVSTVVQDSVTLSSP